MSYTGDTYRVPCDIGGFNANANEDLIAVEAMVDTTRNLILNRGLRETRDGTAHVNDNPITDSPEIVGVFDFTLRNKNQHIIVADSTGRIWKDYITELKSGLLANADVDFEWFANEVFMTNGRDIPQTWDGVAGTTSNITNPAGDWTDNNSAPVQFVNHARGNSRRLVGIGTPTNPNTIYFSASGDAQEFITGVQTVIIETKDGFGILGGVSFIGRLLVFGRRQGFIIDDSDIDNPNKWGYGTAAWAGGTISHKTIVETDTDVHIMSEDGEIYSITAAETFGNYKRGSLIRSSFMHNWIRDNVRFSEKAQFHGVFDPVERAVNWFVVGNGSATINKTLVYYVDRPIEQAWIVRDNENNPCGYHARCSAIVRERIGGLKIYTGGYAGYIWKLGQTTASDNDLAYFNGFKTSKMDFDQPLLIKNYKRCRVIAIGDFQINLRWWVDGVEQPAKTITLGSGGNMFGVGEFGTATFGSKELMETTVDLGANGKRIQFELYSLNAGEKFRVTQLLVDFKPLGVSPE